MEFLRYGPLKAVFALLSIIVLLPSALSASSLSAQENYQNQDNYMAYLRSDYYSSYTPAPESRIADFDIDRAIADGVKFNEVAFLGTHNSYQTTPTAEYQKLNSAVDVLTFGLASDETNNFNMETLTKQLELGIRSLELDTETVVKNGEVSFIVSHDPLFNNTSSCFDFKEALEEIKLWSDANPGHLPVSLIIEPKKNLPAVGNLRNFTVNYACEMDAVIREVFGESLLTPAEMMGEYASFREMRENDGWLPLGETMGKILVLLHDTTVTDGYINRDKSIKTQAMFPMLRYSDRDKSYCSFILENDPKKAAQRRQESSENCKLIVRTRADSYPSYSDARYANAETCGAQIISTDYPVRTQESSFHCYSFGGYTVKLVE